MLCFTLRPAVIAGKFRGEKCLILTIMDCNLLFRLVLSAV